MTYEELTVNAGLVRSLEEMVFGELTDAEIQAVKITAARHQMAEDLRAALEMAQTTSLDDLADAKTYELQTALTYKVLALYFTDYDQGEGSINRAKKTTYTAAYDRQRANFTRLDSTRGVHAGTVILTR